MPAGGEANTTLALVLSIVCMACCGCGLPFGIGGLIYAMNANNAKKTGDLATAQSKARTSIILSIVGAVSGLVAYAAIGVVSQMNSGSF